MNRGLASLASLLLVGAIWLPPGEAAAQGSSMMRGPVVLTAIGDSYTSGEGADPYTTGTNITGQNTCRRSERQGYPSLVARDLERLQQTTVLGDVSLADTRLPGVVVDSQSIACAGATTEDIVGGGNVFDGDDQRRPNQRDEPYPQIAAQRLAQSDLVIGTIGGNDVVFTQILKDCALKDIKTILVPLDDPEDCLSTAEELASAERLLEKIDRRLHDTYRILRSQLGDHAAVYMSSYPYLFPSDRDAQMCATFNLPKATSINGVAYPLIRRYEHSNIPFSPSEQDKIRELQARMNTIMRRAAADEGIHFVDMLHSFDGHTACDPDPWLNVVGLPELKDGVEFSELLDPRTSLDELREDVRFPPVGSFHPNADGYVAMAGTMIETIATPGLTTPLFPTGLAMNPPPLHQQVFGRTPDVPGTACTRSGGDYPYMPDLSGIDCVHNVELDIDGDDRPDRVLLWGRGPQRGARAYLGTGEVLPLARGFDTWDQYGDGPADPDSVIDLDGNGAEELMVTHLLGANTNWAAPLTVRFDGTARRYLDVLTLASGAVASIPSGGGAGYGSAWGCVRSGDQPLLVKAGVLTDWEGGGFTWSVDHYRKVGTQLLAVGHRGGWSSGDRGDVFAAAHALGCSGERPDIGRVEGAARSPEETVRGLLRAVIARDQIAEDVPSSVELRWRPGDHQAALTVSS